MHVGLAQLQRLTRDLLSNVMSQYFAALSFPVEKVDDVDICRCQHIGAGSAGVCLS
jgi:hypothetical protein